MKNTSSLNQVFMMALLAVAVIGVATVASNYQGQVDFNLGTSGVNLQIGGGSQKR
jgi:hypothetical protein